MPGQQAHISSFISLLAARSPDDHTSGQLAKAAKALDVRLSVGRLGQCWDNAVSESFFATLKNKLTEHQPWTTHNALKAAVFDYIESWYNTRRHSSLGQISPAAFEAGQEQIVQQVA